MSEASAGAGPTERGRALIADTAFVGMADEKINYIAVGWERHAKALPPPVAEFRTDLDNAVRESYRSGDAARRNLALLCAGVLTRLDSFALQVERMIGHRDSLLNRLTEALRFREEHGADKPPAGAPVMASFAEHDAAADFESMLFHSRAVLDLMTLAVARRHGHDTHRYSKLGPLLSRLSARSPEAAELAEVLRGASSLSGVLTDLERTSLRSLVTHRGTFTANTTVVFCIYELDGNRQLLLDCEAFGYGLFETAQVLASDIPYLVLNCVAIYVGAERRLPHDDCTPTWDNPTVRLSQWLDGSETGPVLGHVTEMNPDGFVFARQHVRAGIFEKSVPRP